MCPCDQQCFATAGYSLLTCLQPRQGHDMRQASPCPSMMCRLHCAQAGALQGNLQAHQGHCRRKSEPTGPEVMHQKWEVKGTAIVSDQQEVVDP